MKKGFHIPLHFQEAQIKEFGAKLLEPGLYQAVEIKYPYEIIGFDPFSYLRGIESIIQQYAPVVSLHIPTNYDLGVWNSGIRKEILKQVKDAIDFAHTFGANILPIHPGSIGTMDIPVKHETAHERFLLDMVAKKKANAKALTVEALQEISDYAAKYEMTLALENVLLPTEIAYTPAHLLSIIQDVNKDNLKALVDVGHAHRCGIAAGAFIREIGAQLAHVHLTDTDGSCDLHLNLGEGTIDFAAVFAALEEINYTGVMVVESAYRNTEDLLKNYAIIRALLQN
jgi:sugar phosphate isomerase/epimerase